VATFKKYLIYSFVFVIWTLVSTLIAKNVINFNEIISVITVVGYVIFLLLSVLYGLLRLILNLRKAAWSQIKKALFQFVKLFFFNSSLLIGLDYLFRPSHVSLWGPLPISFGLSFAIAFYDLTFSNLKKK
jgi:hypothetical protein